MKRIPLLVCLCLLLSVLQACDEENSIYRGHRCYFFFDLVLHPAPCHLTSVLTNAGQFVTVSTYTNAGIRHIKTQRNYDQAVEDVKLNTAKENQTSCVLGANNAIIIGKSSYSQLLMCYEGQCSNCLENFGGISYPLTWSKNGQQLYCARCKRSYDVNNGVVAAGEGGRQLYTYNIALEGTVLRAWN